MGIPPSHPRYQSLVWRQQIAEGVRRGLVHETGMIAHGRGEAFDYLLGETTIPVAAEAERAAAYALSRGRRPVISVNGNTAVLAGEACVRLAVVTGAALEVNLFHRTAERVEKIASWLEECGGRDVLGREAEARIPGLEHDRARCSREGIYAADVVLVPLEDGDRCQALKNMGKTVLTIDLNPLSRTAQTAHITVVDNVVRAVPAIARHAESEDFIVAWDNRRALQSCLDYLCRRLSSLYESE
ncbi:MAG: 4-phosphopantoate--beta-alanine ligase [Thermoplasmatota archaeon]